MKNSYQQYLTPFYQFEKDGEIGSGLGIAYQYSNTKFYPYSISNEQGRILSINTRVYDKLLLSDYNLLTSNIRYNEYINLPFRHHVLLLQARFSSVKGDRFYSIGENYASNNIRGCTTKIYAKNILSATAEYRFPLFWVERGLGTLPVFLENLSGKIFFDFGGSFNSVSLIRDSLSVIKGTGVELNIQTLFFFEIPVKFTLGIASDLTKLEFNQIYFELTSDIPLVSNNQLEKVKLN